MGMGGQRHDSAALLLEMSLYPLCRRLGGPHCRPGLVRKISPLTGIQFPDRPTCNELLYRLSYTGPQCTAVVSRLLASCSRQGLVAARRTAEPPGNVTRFPKTLTPLTLHS